SHDRQPRAALLKHLVEALERSRQVPDPVGAAPPAMQQRGVHDIQRQDPVGVFERVLQRRVVVGAQVPSEPDDRGRAAGGGVHSRARIAPTMRWRLGRTPYSRSVARNTRADAMVASTVNTASTASESATIATGIVGEMASTMSIAAGAVSG